MSTSGRPALGRFQINSGVLVGAILGIGHAGPGASRDRLRTGHARGKGIRPQRTTPAM